MKRGLVLGGGAARGAYHSGALKALQECGIEFEVVTGTSIGALVGCMVAQNQTQKVIELFERIRIEDVIANGVSIPYDLEAIVENRNEVLRFFRQALGNKCMDHSPLIQLINDCLHLDKLYDSKVDFGLVVFEVAKNRPVMLSKHQISRGEMASYLLASASCFPAFPVCKIGEKTFIDGGYSDNCPVELAMHMGAEELIVVDLNHHITHPVFQARERITYIYPKEDLGSFFDFDKKRMNTRIEMGYYDTLKALGKYEGYRATFHLNSLPSEFCELYVQRLFQIEIQYNKKFQVVNNIEKAQPCTTLLRKMRNNQMENDLKFAYFGVDILVHLLNILSIEPLDASTCVRSACYLYQEAQKSELYQEEGLKQFNFERVLQIRNALSERQLVFLITSILLKGKMNTRVRAIIRFFPQECCAAILLVTWMQKYSENTWNDDIIV